MTEIHVETAGDLHAIRCRLAKLRKAAGLLNELHHPELARDLIREAGDLAAMTVWVPVRCLLHDGTFEASFPADGPPDFGAGPGICGPCNARAEAAVSG